MLLPVFLGACRGQDAEEVQALEEARRLLAAADFDEPFDKALALLDTIPAQTADRELAYQAFLLKARAHLDLFLAAFLTARPDLYQKLKAATHWELDGELTDIRNFQALCQDILEEFRLVEREAGAWPRTQQAAAALALFTDGLQGVAYRAKASYFKGRDAAAAEPQTRYLDDLLALRDLVAETLVRTNGPAGNWQNVVLTVAGRVCEKDAARFVATACEGSAEMGKAIANKWCPVSISELSHDSLAHAAAAFSAACVTGEGDSRRQGVDSIVHYYDAARERLRTSTLPRTLADWVAAAAPRAPEAYSALRTTIFTP